MAAFPYVAVSESQTDIQPYFLILQVLGTVVLWMGGGLTVTPTVKYLLILAAFASLHFAVFVLAGRSDILTGSRQLFGYLALAISTLYFYNALRLTSSRIVVSVVIIWTMGFLLQVVFGFEIMAPFLGRLSTGGGRGFTSFSPEPSFYAKVLLVLSLWVQSTQLAGRLSVRVSVSLYALIALQVLFTFSVTAILIIPVVLFQVLASYVTARRAVAVAGLVAMVAAGIFVTADRQQIIDVLNQTETRSALYLASKIDATSADDDYSSSVRLVNPLIALYGGLVESFGLGVGMGLKPEYWTPYPEALQSVAFVQWQIGEKLLGGLVSIVYELGIIGLWLLVLTLGSSLRAAVSLRGSVVRLLAGANIAVFYLMYDSIATPYLGLLLALSLGAGDSVVAVQQRFVPSRRYYAVPQNLPST